MKDVLIMGTPSCGWCEQGKILLDTLSIPYRYQDISRDPRTRFQLQVKGITTVPAIFIDDEYIGGYDDLLTLISDGAFDD